MKHFLKRFWLCNTLSNNYYKDYREFYIIPNIRIAKYSEGNTSDGIYIYLSFMIFLFGIKLTGEI